MKNKIVRLHMNLQLFATGENNDLPARSYQLEFKELLSVVFRSLSYFSDFFGGGLEALDGVRENETAFYVKTSDIPVVVGDSYDKGANTAFGTGTGNTTRFGKRTEVIYTNTPVEYSWEWVYHEGIDRHTVNNDFDVAVADRLELQARAKTAQFNDHHSKFIAESAEKVLSIETYSADNVLKLFDDMSAYFNNIEAVGTKVAKVNSTLYNAIVNHPLMTTGKNSSTNIDDNEVVRFKGFNIQEIPDKYFQDDDCCYAYITGIGKAFTGINTVRTIESEDFDGVALQGAGKAGEYVLPDNKKAIVKVTAGTANGLDNLTVTSQAGSTSGTTQITVSPTVTAGNSYKYKIAENAVLPAVGQSVKNWSAWDGTSDITAATGQEIVVVECDDKYHALKGGVATVTAMA